MATCTQNMQRAWWPVAIEYNHCHWFLLILWEFILMLSQVWPLGTVQSVDTELLGFFGLVGPEELHVACGSVMFLNVLEVRCYRPSRQIEAPWLGPSTCGLKFFCDYLVELLLGELSDLVQTIYSSCSIIIYIYHDRLWGLLLWAGCIGTYTNRKLLVHWLLWHNGC